jgi:hypothetical protein
MNGMMKLGIPSIPFIPFIPFIRHYCTHRPSGSGFGPSTTTR